MSNSKEKKNIFGKISEHPVTSLVVIFSVYLIATLLSSLAFPWLSKVIFPNLSIGIYNKDFWLNLLVNLNASLIDFFFFGIALFLLQRRNERNSAISDMINELSDISKYNDQVVNLRKVGIIRRLGELKHHQFKMHRMAISGKEIELRDIEFKNSDFTGMEGEDIYVNGLKVSHSTLVSATFNRARVRNSKFKFSNLKNIKFNEAKIKGNTFASCNFTGASFRNADLKSTILIGCIMKNVNYDGAILDRANLKGVKNLDVDSLCKAKSLNYIVVDDAIKQQIKIRVPGVKFSR